MKNIGEKCKREHTVDRINWNAGRFAMASIVMGLSIIFTGALYQELCSFKTYRTGKYETFSHPSYSNNSFNYPLSLGATGVASIILGTGMALAYRQTALSKCMNMK